MTFQLIAKCAQKLKIQSMKVALDISEDKMTGEFKNFDYFDLSHKGPRII
jgi:hypothetical protein